MCIYFCSLCPPLPLLYQKGEFLADVADEDPSYITWIIRDRVYEGRPELERGLVGLGLLE